ncbi:MAG: hypothetical protein CVU47_12400 [Chloroflexi bacterium HGW-Chloroflexi-9]|nr:MAG: hypothetical protein CVU47_12400 [Chloroflexi bacterium HGW-Chloroflexi-9]
MITPPATSSGVGISSSHTAAIAAAATGSPRIATATTAAGSDPSAQLKALCPINCGTSAIAPMNRYASIGNPRTGVPAEAARATRTAAVTP